MKKEGLLEEKNNIHIIDLPGIYSLSTYSIDEVVATSYLMEEKPDAIVNIVDATNIERNLYLTMQLLELNIPMIVVFNMMDLVKKQQQTIHIAEITKILGVPVMAVSAQKKTRSNAANKRNRDTFRFSQKPQYTIFRRFQIHS